MRLHFFPYESKLEMEVVRPVITPWHSLFANLILQLTNSANLQEYASSSPFSRLHEIYGPQGYEGESAATSRRSSVSSTLVDIEPLVFLPTATDLLQPIEEEEEILQPARFTAHPPVSTPPQLLVSEPPTTTQPDLQYTSFASTTPYIDPDMPEGVNLSPPPALSTPVKIVNTAPLPRRSVLSSSVSSGLKTTKKRGRRVSISDEISVFRPLISEEGNATM